MDMRNNTHTIRPPTPNPSKGNAMLLLTIEVGRLLGATA